MPADNIRYDLLTQDALRGVIRTVLTNAAAKGLPGDHHFFITFDTRAEGVRMSPRLKASYPEEMTIVLQHQFWDLDVGEQSFSVTLSFQKQLEQLTVPFAAIRSFADPSVNFALEFSVPEAAAAEPAPRLPVAVETPPKAEDRPAGQVVALDAFRKR
jgi:hypothetical protein